MLGSDGNAHMTIFVNNHSFVWDGSKTIEVSRGGYGEPVTETITLIHDYSSYPVKDAMHFLSVYANNYS